jgi:hypothetical protein
LCEYRDEPAVYQTFLPQVLGFDRWDYNPEFDPSRRPHPSENVRFRVWVARQGCLAINPPLLVEDIIFPEPRAFPPSKGQTVGERLQTPRTLDGNTVEALWARLREQRP